MRSKTIQHVAARLPQAFVMNYFADRQSPWLLAHRMAPCVKVGQLRQGPLAKLLDRPAMRTLVARSGGTLRRADVTGVAFADDLSRLDTVGPAGEAALDEVWNREWMDFEITFAAWGTLDTDWQYHQTSRPGQNLVIQLGFPSAHDRLLRRYLPAEARHRFEDKRHPIRQGRRPTLAWARVDLDMDLGDALIEEVQSDWLRLVKCETDDVQHHWPGSRSAASYLAYRTAVTAHYGKIWPQAMLFAALSVLRDRLGFRRIWMHQPESGAILKGIDAAYPPRSLYRQLPKAFCFAETREAPPFLCAKRKGRQTRPQRVRLRQIRRLQRLGQSIFWRLDL